MWLLVIRVKFGACEKNWDFFGSFVPIGTKSQIWDLIGSTALGEGASLMEWNSKLNFRLPCRSLVLSCMIALLVQVWTRFMQFGLQFCIFVVSF